MEKEIFLVEEMENRLAIEAVSYKRKIDEQWETHKFDPTYFDTFISGEMYREFIQAIYDRIKPLNTHEANRFLTLSVAQFKTHTPEKREQDFILNYHNTYWFPNVVEFKGSEHEVKFAQHVWKHYKNNFNTFKEAAEKALEDFKSGLLGSQPTQVKAEETSTPKIKNESLNIFLKQLTYNYPYGVSTLFFKYSMRDNLDYLKQEILDNLISLSKDDRKPYLNKLKYSIGNNRQHSTITKDDIDIWLKKYKIESEEDIRFTKEGNVIYRILDSEPPTMDEEFEENFNRDTHDIQFEFYNYYYGFYIDEAVKFIDEQINEHSPNPIVPSLNNQEKQEQKPPSPKLKTNLTVTELAFLFKMLNELKPDIFRMESDAELFRFISANIETKKSGEDGISVQKLRNLFSDPDLKAVKFWEKHFHTFIAEVKKYK